MSPSRERVTLLVSIFAVASCALAYELVIATTSSYLLGDSIRVFSFTIGIFLSAMGLGAFLSERMRGDLLPRFIAIELAIAAIGGFSIPGLFLAYTYTENYPLLLYLLLGLLGTLIGFEIPLLVRVLQDYGTLRINLSRVLALDYLGSLAASLLFPTLLLPALGLLRTSLLFGLVNTAVVLLTCRVFRDHGRFSRRYTVRALLLGGCLLGAFLASSRLVRWSESRLYTDQIIHARQTPYQRIVLTRWKDDLRLYLDGSLQFSSIDEYRYHETLVHPLLSALPHRARVLVLGGGDGLAVREILKYRDVEEITLVDIDPALVELCRENPMLRRLNRDALRDPRVTVHHEDAFRFVQENSRRFQAIVVDLPDPHSEKLAKLYSREFYALLAQSLARDGGIVVQATSPYFAPAAFRAILATIRAAGLFATPIHAYVPAFGDWGFVLAAPFRRDWTRSPPAVATRFLDPDQWRALFTFPKDLPLEGGAVSTLDHPRILSLYEAGWKHFFGGG